MKLDINLTLFKFTAVAEAGKKGDDLTKLFFKEEYMLNNAIGELICISPPKNDLPVWNFFQKVFSFKYNTCMIQDAGNRFDAHLGSLCIVFTFD